MKECSEEKPGINPFFCPCRLVSYKSGDILNDFSLIQHSHHLPAELQLDEDKITRRMPDKILETGAVTSQSPSNTCFPSWANRDPILQRIVATQIRPTPKKPTDHVPQWPTRSTVGQVGSLLSKEPKPVSRMLQTKPPGTKLSLKKISQFRPFSIKKRGLKSMKFARVHPMKTRSQSVQLFWELNAGGATISKLKW